MEQYIVLSLKLRQVRDYFGQAIAGSLVDDHVWYINEV